MQQIQITNTHPLPAPACENCGGTTRLVGLEPTFSDKRTDLCTYECTDCSHSQTRVHKRELYAR